MRIVCESCNNIYVKDIGSVLELGYNEIGKSPTYYLCLGCTNEIISLIESGKLEGR